MACSKEVAKRESDAALHCVESHRTIKRSKALLAHMKNASTGKAEEAHKKTLLADGSEVDLNEELID